MSHINYSFNQTDDSLPRDKMKLRNIASTRYSGDWPSIPHSHSYLLYHFLDGILRNWITLYGSIHIHCRSGVQPHHRGN